MLHIIKFLVGRSVLQRLLRFSRTFSRFIKTESDYTSAVVSEAIRAAAIIASAVVVLCAILIAVSICGVAAALIAIPRYFPNADIQIIISTLILGFILLGVATAIFVAWYVQRIKRIVTEYRLHWGSESSRSSTRRTKLSDLNQQALATKDRCIDAVMHPEFFEINKQTSGSSLLTKISDELSALTRKQPLAAVLSATAIGGISERAFRIYEHLPKQQIERIKAETLLVLRANLEGKAVAFLAAAITRLVASAANKRKNRS